MKNWKSIRELIQNERQFVQNPVINYLLMVLLEITEKKIHRNQERWKSKSAQRRVWASIRACKECGIPLPKSDKNYKHCKKCRWNRNIDLKKYRSRRKIWKSSKKEKTLS